MHVVEGLPSSVVSYQSSVEWIGIVPVVVEEVDSQIMPAG